MAKKSHKNWYRNQHRRKSDDTQKPVQPTVTDEGKEYMEAGLDAVQLGRDLAGGAMDEVAAGARDMTRAIDSAVVADRLGTLSKVAASAGVNDIAQGTELMLASEDVAAMSAAVGLMSLDDLQSGLHVGRIAGELETISQVLSVLEMPVVAAILVDRSLQLQEIATNTVLQAAASHGLSEVMNAAGKQLGEMGEEEMDEGLLRVAAAKVAKQRAEELEAQSVELGIKGMTEIANAAQTVELATEVANQGIEAVAVGSAQMASGKQVVEYELELE